MKATVDLTEDRDFRNTRKEHNIIQSKPWDRRTKKCKLDEMLETATIRISSGNMNLNRSIYSTNTILFTNGMNNIRISSTDSDTTLSYNYNTCEYSLNKNINDNIKSLNYGKRKIITGNRKTRAYKIKVNGYNCELPRVFKTHEDKQICICCNNKVSPTFMVHGVCLKCLKQNSRIDKRLFGRVVKCKGQLNGIKFTDSRNFSIGLGRYNKTFENSMRRHRLSLSGTNEIETFFEVTGYKKNKHNRIIDWDRIISNADWISNNVSSQTFNIVNSEWDLIS